MGEDDRPPGIDAGGQVVGHHVVDVVLQITDAVAIVDHLVVGNDQEGLDPGVLQPHPVLERPEVMPDVEATGGTIPGQQSEPAWVRGNLRFDLVTTLLRALEGLLCFCGGPGFHARDFIARRWGGHTEPPRARIRESISR